LTADIANGAISDVTIHEGGDYRVEYNSSIQGSTALPTITITPVGGPSQVIPQLDGSFAGIVLTNPGSGYTSAPTVTIAPPSVAIGDGGVQATAVATVDAQGRLTSVQILNPGVGYINNSAYSVTFSGGGGSGASAVLLRNLVGARVVQSADDYRVAPPVVIEHGRGATATATVSGGAVSGVNMTSGGLGYGNGKPVIVEFSGGSSSRSAFGVANVSSLGSISSVSIIDGGQGYTSAPSVIIREPGTAVSPTAIMTSRIKSVRVVDGGFGYFSTPSVEVAAPEDGNGRRARITVTTANGAVIGATVEDGGTGYVSLPSISVSGPQAGTNDNSIQGLLGSHPLSTAFVVGWDGSAFVGANANYGERGRIGLPVPGRHAPGFAQYIGDGWETMRLEKDATTSRLRIRGGNDRADHDAGLQIKSAIPYRKHVTYVTGYIAGSTNEIYTDKLEYRILENGTDTLLSTPYTGHQGYSAIELEAASGGLSTAPWGTLPFGLDQQINGYTEVVLTFTGVTP
jgi:hypothetical protein